MVKFHLTFIVPITSTHSHTSLTNKGHTSVPPTSTHSHNSLTHTWTGVTHLCPSHLHSQPHLPHPYLDRRDTPLSLPPPLTATPPTPIPGQEGHASVPPTSTHSHTSHTHTWTGGTRLCPSHLYSQPHLPHPYLDRRDTPTSTHSHTSLTHTWTGGTHLCPSLLHSQPHLPHPYLDRRDTPLSLRPPFTATPPSPIPGQEGHTSVPPTSTHSHTSLTHI